MCKDIKMRVSENGYKNSDAVMKNGVLLPVHHGLSESMFKRFGETVDDFIKTITD